LFTYNSTEVDLISNNSFIRAYKVHERAPLDGVPIIEVKGRNAKAAASEYRKVVDELLRGSLCQKMELN
jgi:hypothetical protein